MEHAPYRVAHYVVIRRAIFLAVAAAVSESEPDLTVSRESSERPLRSH
jgi:hypothetical protein